MKKSIWLLAFCILPVTLWAQISTFYNEGPNMNFNRMNQLHTNYEDHTVLLFGGHGTNFVSLNTCEIYDYTSNPISLFNMNAPHDYGSFVKLNDFEYLLMGGSADLGVAPGNNVAEIFNVSTKTFSLLPAAMNYGRMYSGSTLLNNGNVLIAGGWYNEPSATYGEIYNPNTQTFTLTGALNTPRAGLTLVSTPDGKATIFGGTDIYGNTYYQNIEEYDPATNQFTTVSDYFFPDEPNWRLVYQPKLNTDNSLGEDLYMYLIFNSDSLKYGLMTFNPQTKKFSKYKTHPDLNIPSTYTVNDIEFNYSRDVGFIVCSYPENGITEVGVYAIILPYHILYETQVFYEMPSSYSLGSASVDAVGDNKLLICGGSTGVGYDYNFMPVNNTFQIYVGGVGVKEVDNNIPKEYSLSQNYPNPFNPSTKI